MARKSSTAAAASVKHGYEFGGPPVVAFIIFAIHAVPYAMAYLCNEQAGCPVPSLLHPSNFNWQQLQREAGWTGLSSLLNVDAFLATLGWYFFSLVLYAFVPATEALGVELRNGARLKYRMNAFNSAVLTSVILAVGTFLRGADFVVWTFIWDNYVPILTSNIIIAWFLSTYTYVASFGVMQGNKEHRELAAGGATGNMMYDWFIGRELNPRVKIPLFGEVDIKSWMELRPGMLGWILLDCAFMAKQYRLHGYVTDSMFIVTIAQAVYVFDALYMEPAILTTIDIISDGFGFMLADGDLVWLPFTYSIQAKYLAIHPKWLGPWRCALIFGVQLLGYWIFRSANNEKNRFRNNPEDPVNKNVKFMTTKNGSKLITNGWWGSARHINYLGDWIMSWSYCLPTWWAGYEVLRTPGLPGLTKDTIAVVPGGAAGWGTIFTYFYMLYFAILLVHRERRDEEKCRRKYGKDWERYCKKVPSRIIPGIY